LVFNSSTIRYDIWYDIWYDMIYDMTWHDMIWNMIWYIYVRITIYDMIWYDYMICYMIYIYDTICLLTEIRSTSGGSSTVHIYTQTIHRTTQWNGIYRTEHTFKLHPTTLHYPLIRLNPFKFTTAPFHLTSLHFTSLHFTAHLDDFRHTSIPFISHRS